ncbi:hypothetical protein KC347_g7877 [Hortaea werneckii]|nr:hypothetical protein KC347_g7877 [Hortaea werneckii]
MGSPPTSPPLPSAAAIQDLPTLLTEPELLSTPMEDIHKDLALLHFRRLHRILYATDPTASPVHTSRAVAWGQLACMTKVVRGYLARVTAGKGMGEDVGESMIADVVEACLSLDSLGQGAGGGVGEVCFGSRAAKFPDGRVIGGENSIQERRAHNATHSPSPVDELRRLPPDPAQAAKASPLPTEPSRHDLGSDLNWADVLHRSRSEDDLLHRHKQGRQFRVLETRDRIRDRLLRPVENGIGISWPPRPPREPLTTMPLPSSSSLPVASPPLETRKEQKERRTGTKKSAPLPSTAPSYPPVAPPLLLHSPPTNPSTTAVTTTISRRNRKRTDVSETLTTWKDYLVRNRRAFGDYWCGGSVHAGRERQREREREREWGVDVFLD